MEEMEESHCNRAMSAVEQLVTRDLKKLNLKFSGRCEIVVYPRFVRVAFVDVSKLTSNVKCAGSVEGIEEEPEVKRIKMEVGEKPEIVRVYESTVVKLSNSMENLFTLTDDGVRSRKRKNDSNSKNV